MNDNASKASVEETDCDRAQGLVFKHEAEVEGEPIGPATILPLSPTGDAQTATVPFVPNCVCERPVGSPGDRCESCGDEIAEPWVTLSEAKARARDPGIEMRET